MIDNGHKILFENAPTNYSFENRGSTIKYNDFVIESICELFKRGCIKEFSYLPEFILHLSHLDTMFVKKSFSDEDLRTESRYV